MDLGWFFVDFGWLFVGLGWFFVDFGWFFDGFCGFGMVFLGGHFGKKEGGVQNPTCRLI